MFKLLRYLYWRAYYGVVGRPRPITLEWFRRTRWPWIKRRELPPDAFNARARLKMQEEGIYRKIMPPEAIEPTELTKDAGNP